MVGERALTKPRRRMKMIQKKRRMRKRQKKLSTLTKRLSYRMRYPV